MLLDVYLFVTLSDVSHDYAPIAEGIGGIATAIALFVIVRMFSTDRQHLFIRSFSELIEQIGSESTKNSKKLIMEQKDILKEFIEKYGENYDSTNDDNKKYSKIEDACRHLCRVYNRVCVILANDKKIKKEFLNFHGDAILEVWISVEKYVNKRIDIDTKKHSKFIPYRYFKDIGEEVVKMNRNDS
jgi:hypothetical protein